MANDHRDIVRIAANNMLEAAKSACPALSNAVDSYRDRTEDIYTRLHLHLERKDRRAMQYLKAVEVDQSNSIKRNAFHNSSPAVSGACHFSEVVLHRISCKKMYCSCTCASPWPEYLCLLRFDSWFACCAASPTAGARLMAHSISQ